MDKPIKNSLISPSCTEEEYKLEVTLRPAKLNDYVGQEKVKSNLAIFIEAAKKRREALDHVLFYGPPGLGKTTLAYIIAKEMGVDIKVTSGPVIERPGDLAAILTNMQEHEILFIDEIHRLSHVVEEILYPAMEDFHIDILIGQGPSAQINETGYSQIYSGWRNNTRRFTDFTFARSFWHALPPGILLAARTCDNYQEICFYFGSKTGRCRC